MNLRRMNVTERTKLYGKFAMLMFLVWCIALYLPVVTDSINASKYRIPLENRTCYEIYNKTVHGQLFSDNKKNLYKPESVILYYMENCHNETEVIPISQCVVIPPR